jgi:hypothetical protein
MWIKFSARRNNKIYRQLVKQQNTVLFEWKEIISVFQQMPATTPRSLSQREFLRHNPQLLHICQHEIFC